MAANDLLNEGIAALKAGRKTAARRLFAQVIQQDKNNEMAWLWLSGIVDTARERRICLENALAINPDNEVVRRELAQLLSREGVQPLATAAVESENTSDLFIQSPPETSDASVRDRPSKPNAAATRRTRLILGLSLGALVICAFSLVGVWLAVASGLLTLDSILPGAPGKPKSAAATFTPTLIPTWTPTPSSVSTLENLNTPAPTLEILNTPAPVAVSYTPTPNPTRISITPPAGSAPWLASVEANGLVYFLFSAATPRIERYSFDSETWLDPIMLDDVPTAFAVDGDGIYISFGRRTSRFALDGTNETHLHNTDSEVHTLFTLDDFLYLHYGRENFLSINKRSGDRIDAKEFWYGMTGVSVAPSKGKVFGRTVGVSPADIVEIILNEDGTFGAQSDSRYHGDYPSASRTFMFPNEARVADSSGIVYNTIDLSYSNSFASPIDDLAFYGEDIPIVLHDGTLIAYSNTLQESGRYTPAESPIEISVAGDFIYAFKEGSARGVQVDKIPIGLLEPEDPGQGIEAAGLAYVPDSVLLGKGEIVYLLSQGNLSVFRWSIPERQYLETIPLVDAPSYMAYSKETNRLYLAYSSGKITQIKLDESTSEQPFVNSPQTPLGLATAGPYVFVVDATGAWVSHFTYHPDGSLLSQVDWNYFSEEYVWSEANRKMYFFRDDTSPNDLLWEEIDISGVIRNQKDSPEHSSAGINHPIRVSPDGSTVLLGSGRIYDPITLEQVDSLSNDISDAVWRGGTLFTLRGAPDGDSEVQQWNANYAIAGSFLIDGDPIRLFSVDEGIFLITRVSDQPVFSILQTDVKKGPEDDAVSKVDTEREITPATRCLDAQTAGLIGGDTFLCMNSERGDYIGGGQLWTWMPRDEGDMVMSEEDGGVSVIVSGWRINLIPPKGQALTTTTYEGATRYPFNEVTEPGLSVSGHGRGCNKLTGSFEILELEYDSSRKVERFAANFEQHCEGGTPALYGYVRYNSTVEMR